MVKTLEQINQEFFELWQIIKVVLVGAGDDVPIYIGRTDQSLNRPDCFLEALRVTAQPVMRLFKSIQTDCSRTHSGI